MSRKPQPYEPTVNIAPWSSPTIIFDLSTNTPCAVCGSTNRRAEGCGRMYYCNKCNAVIKDNSEAWDKANALNTNA